MRPQTSICRFTLRQLTACLTVLCLLLALNGQARAQGTDVSVVFNPVSMTGGPTDTLDYTAIFTNLTGGDLYVNNATFNATDPNFNGFGFFNGNGMGGGQFVLLANQMLTVSDVVSIDLNGTPPGNYNVDATFTGFDYVGGSPTGTERALGTGTLNAVVTAGSPTPEFGAAWSLGGLLVAGGAGLLRQRRQRVNAAQEQSTIA